MQWQTNPDHLTVEYKETMEWNGPYGTIACEKYRVSYNRCDEFRTGLRKPDKWQAMIMNDAVSSDAM